MTESNALDTDYQRTRSYTHLFDDPEPKPGWHVLWTRSNFEWRVYDQLCAKGYDAFLPMVTQWSRRKGAEQRTCRVPMFKSYLFLHHAVDKEAYIDISKTDGLVNILGQRWDRLAYVPEREIETVKLAMSSELPAMPFPYLRKGSKVRVVRGPLLNAEGIMVESDPEKGLFVISVDLLCRSIAVEIDCADVVPV